MVRRVALRALLLPVLLLIFNAACQPAKPVAKLKPGDVLGTAVHSGFDRAIQPRAMHFPRDHGAHPRFKTEWWYLTGHLWSGQREFGYQVSLFRFGLRPGASTAEDSWRADQIYMAHFALTDLEAGVFHAAERLSRGAAGLAGAATEGLDVWVEDISMSLREGVLRVRAADRGYLLDLELTPTRSPLLHGEHGLSRKSATAGNASYYYSMPRWSGAGLLRSPEGDFQVTGDGWLDREWSSGSLSAEHSGWDWFALQLDDGSELMLYRLRYREGGADAFSQGTFIGPGGDPVILSAGEVRFGIKRRWESPVSRARYPVAWRIEIPTLELAVDLEALADDQELDLSFRYWEGAARVSGRRQGNPVTGRAYLELTGYE